MKNQDEIMTKEQIREKMQKALADNDPEAFSEAFDAFQENLQEETLREAREMRGETDALILSNRGVRQLTAEEKKYFSALGEAMKASDPKQAVTNLDIVMPKTTIDAVFDDLKDNHPLIGVINFVNTSGLIEFLVNTNTRQLASWGTLSATVSEELAGSFKKVNMTLCKLSAFIPVAKSMLDLGPAWLDRYVRTVLSEAIAEGLETAIIKGTGKNEPIGMSRQVGTGVTVTDGVYPEKTATPITSLDPKTYGSIIKDLATTPNGNSRTVNGVVLIVNPTDYLQKIMPATTMKAASGEYVSNIFPFPTSVVQSVAVDSGKAIIGLADRYFMGLGTAKSGKIEYSDDYHFLEDERVYLTKLYGYGEPLDNSAFEVLDISGLEPMTQKVEIKGKPQVIIDGTPEVTVKGTVKTKEDTTTP